LSILTNPLYDATDEVVMLYPPVVKRVAQLLDEYRGRFMAADDNDWEARRVEEIALLLDAMDMLTPPGPDWDPDARNARLDELWRLDDPSKP